MGRCKCSCKVPKRNYTCLTMTQVSGCLINGKSSVEVVISLFDCTSLFKYPSPLHEKKE